MVTPLNLILFALFWIAAVYALNCAIARRFLRIEPKMALLYVLTVAMIGVFGEIFLDTVYKFFFDVPLWRYNILPVHHAYTSYFATVIWGIYGFHLYLLHGTLHSKWSITRTRHLALILCIEALILEALLTISAKFILGDYMYYYYPNDLWHVTSIQNIPFYFICGAVIVQTIRRFKADPMFFSALSASMMFVVVFLAN